jgi:nucleoside-diphosphate-sugar epimerase
LSRVVVVGCGYVGRVLAQSLADEGREVFAVRRSEVPPGKGITWLRADLASPSSIETLRAGLAGETPLDLFYLVGADARSDEAYRVAYVDGLTHLLAAVEDAPVRRLLFASSTAVYAQADGSWVDEDSIAEPTGFSGRRLLEGEGVALAAPMDACVVRYGGIYGPGRTRLIDRLLEGQAIVAMDDGRYRNRMHRDDCAKTMAHLASLERVERHYLGVDDEPAELREVQRWLCDRIGVNAADLEPPARSARGGHKRCRNARLRASGMVLQHPSYRSGYGELLTRLRSR